LANSFDPKLGSSPGHEMFKFLCHGLIWPEFRVETSCQINKHYLQVSWLWLWIFIDIVYNYTLTSRCTNLHLRYGCFPSKYNNTKWLKFWQKNNIQIKKLMSFTSVSVHICVCVLGGGGGGQIRNCISAKICTTKLVHHLTAMATVHTARNISKFHTNWH
jgi:hypothetical protein